MAARTQLAGSRRSPVLETLADLYAESTAGRTGISAQDYGIRFEELLRKARCDSGDAYANALADLEAMDGVALTLIRDRRSHYMQRVKVPLSLEAALFARIGRASPSQARGAWVEMMNEAAMWTVPPAFAETWNAFCRQRAESMHRGEGWQPFRRKQRRRARIQLEVVSRLLAWTTPALLRTVSVQVAESSKFLERSRATLQMLLEEVTGGKLRIFEDLKISDNPRSVRFHGPVRVRLAGQLFDYSGHAGSSSLSEDDLRRAEAIECSSPRCVTVENETNFHQLCRLGSGDLFVFTSYPNRATVEFLRRLPASMERYHFGDTDPWGYDVLRSLRVALKPAWVAPLHMTFRPSEESRALNDRDRKKLLRLLADPLVSDVREELEMMLASNSKGRFEQEALLVSGQFPYRSPDTEPTTDHF